MKAGGSMPHLQGLSNNPYPQPNQSNSSYGSIYIRFILIFSSHLRLGLPKNLLPVVVPVKIIDYTITLFKTANALGAGVARYLRN